MIRKLFLWLALALLALVVVLAVNTLRKGSRQLDVPAIPALALDKDRAAQHLAEAVRARTISSRTDAAQNTDQFLQLHALLQARYRRPMRCCSVRSSTG